MIWAALHKKKPEWHEWWACLSVWYILSDDINLKSSKVQKVTLTKSEYAILLLTWQQHHDNTTSLWSDFTKMWPICFDTIQGTQNLHFPVIHQALHSPAVKWWYISSYLKGDSLSTHHSIHDYDVDQVCLAFCVFRFAFCVIFGQASWQQEGPILDSCNYKTPI